MTDTMTSQNIDLSFWDTLHIASCFLNAMVEEGGYSGEWCRVSH
jgi:hypothetical protein